MTEPPPYGTPEAPDGATDPATDPDPPPYGPYGPYGPQGPYAEPDDAAPAPYGTAEPPGPGSSYGPGVRVVGGPQTATLALLAVGGVMTFTCWLALGGLPALVLAIVALVKGRDDERLARRLTRIGWIVLVGGTALSIVLFAVFVILAAALGGSP